MGAACALVHELAGGNLGAIHRRLHPDLETQISSSSLASQWQEIVGAPEASSEIRLLQQKRRGAYHAVYLVVVLAQREVAVEVVLDRALRVHELRLRAPHTDEELTRVARDLFELLRRQDWLAARTRLAPALEPRLPEITAAMAQLSARFGEPTEVLGAEVSTSPFGATVDLECAFTRRAVLARFSIDHRQQVTEVFFRPGWRPPSYARSAAFEERPAIVGGSRYPLPGTLTLPRARAPVAAVVLVHGSGPTDQDGTLGPNKPLKDLAWGLASRGIAVLRYTKRTARYRGLPAAEIPTVNEETMEDARSAVDLLRRTPGVDPRRIVLVGHSLGAALAPRMAAADPRLAAIVLLAGPARPQGVLLLEQMRYLLALSRTPAAAQERQLHEVAEEARRRDTAPLDPSAVVNGTRGSYWLDLRAHPGPPIAARLRIPILVVQGGRDYQVGKDDLSVWRHALAAAPAASFKLYPTLNHLLMPGRGRPLPAEYQRHGHVARAVILDLAGWINRLPSTRASVARAPRR